MEENKNIPKKKKALTFNELRVDQLMAMAKDFRENENLSYKDAHKKANIIDSYLHGGHFKRDIKYRGDDKLILRNLPDSRKDPRVKKNTSILNKGN